MIWSLQDEGMLHVLHLVDRCGMIVAGWDTMRKRGTFGDSTSRLRCMRGVTPHRGTLKTKVTRSIIFWSNPVLLHKGSPRNNSHYHERKSGITHNNTIWK